VHPAPWRPAWRCLASLAVGTAPHPTSWCTRSIRTHLGNRPEHEVPGFCSSRGAVPGGPGERGAWSPPPQGLGTKGGWVRVVWDEAGLGKCPNRLKESSCSPQGPEAHMTHGARLAPYLEGEF
jgi:hypothetical protein